jgi:hypothetical protein
MSVERLTALEHRVAVLERRQRSSLVIAGAGCAVLALASLIPATHAQSPSQVRAPFSVVNAGGQEIFSVTQAGSNTRVSIVDRGTVITTWSADAEGAELSLGVAKSKGLARLAVDFNGADTGPSLLLADSTDELLAVEKGSVEISAPLTVSPKDTPVLKVEPDSVTVTSTVNVRASKGGNRASLGPTSLSIHGGDGASVAASLGLDTVGRGRLVVGLPSGPRGVLGQPADGGISFALFDGPGAQYRIGMLASPQSSSFLRLYSGKRQIELNVNPASGSLHLFNDAGYAAASIDATPGGFGKISLGDAAGDAVVEAGLTTDGLGVVRTGPDMGGTTGAMSGGLVVPRAILGRRAK